MKIGRDMPWAMRIYISRFIDTIFQFLLVVNFAYFGGFNVYSGSLIVIKFQYYESS